MRATAPLFIGLLRLMDRLRQWWARPYPRQIGDNE